MNSSRRSLRFFLLMALLAAELIAFNIGAIYYFFFYRKAVENTNDERLTFQPPAPKPKGASGSKERVRHDVPSQPRSVPMNAHADDPSKCIEIDGKPCKWWPKVEGINMVCVYSASYPDKATNIAGALFDSEKDCCAKYCIQRKRESVAEVQQKRKSGLPWWLNRTARESHGLDIPLEEEAALKKALKAGNVLLKSNEDAEQCNQLLQQRAYLLQEMSNLENEKKRKMHGREDISSTHQMLGRDLNFTVTKIEALTNCSYPQLIMHRLRDGRLINDPTLPWNNTMYRPWLDPLLPADGRPKFMLLLTTKGWNQPNVVEALKYARHKFETEFYSALINHPYFHPTAWDDIGSGKLDIQPHGVNYYVFPDLAQSKMQNYPIYAGGRNPNMDRSFYRTLDKQLLIDGCSKTLGITSARLFKELRVNSEFGSIREGVRPSTANLIVFTLRGHEEGNDRRECTKAAYDMPVVTVSLDGRFPYINEGRGDQGMIPPPVKRASMTLQDEHDIKTCAAETKKRFHVSYVGNFRSLGSGARMKYQKLHDNKRNIILRYFKKEEMKKSAIANMTYEEVLKSSEFALAPRGDNKYSFRFTEVLSAGAIPIYHADDYVYPFRIVDWNRCAIILPEKMAGQPTLDHIANLSSAERCKMRNYCYFNIYKKYIETPMKMLNGYVEGLEAVMRSNTTIPLAGIRCNASSIESKDCNPI